MKIGLSILILFVVVVFCEEPPLVLTKYGLIEGVTGDTYHAYLGVPFVVPPLGQLRWTSPLPRHSDWFPFIRKATSFKPGCPQNCQLPPHTCPDTYSEDCLYLNIYTPKMDQSAKPPKGVPVMVFFPGGHFEMGGPGVELYQPVNMVTMGDVVVVTVAYRLGFLGWLTTSTIGGNFGFSDQVQALEWIQGNIADFGGDPGQVTLFGQSAGATSIRAHLISPASKGLFHQVISQSDPFSLPMRDDGPVFGNEFVNQTGCHDIVCLRGLNITEIINAQNIVEKEVDLARPIENFLPFTPTIDGKLIPSHFFDAVKAGKVANVPMIIGDVSQDALLFVYQAFNFSLNTLVYETIVSAIFTTNKTAVQAEYPPVDGDERPLLSVLGTDYIFDCPSRYIYSILQKTNPDIYLYLFDHPLPGYIWGPKFPYCANQVCHAAELPFLFYSDLIAPMLNFTMDEINLSKSMIGYWVNFATNGDPNMGIKPAINWPKWNPSTLQNIHFETPANFIESKLRQKNCDFFDTIGYVHGW